jgi:hypothetical protein
MPVRAAPQPASESLRRLGWQGYEPARVPMALAPGPAGRAASLAGCATGRLPLALPVPVSADAGSGADGYYAFR